MVRGAKHRTRSNQSKLEQGDEEICDLTAALPEQWQVSRDGDAAGASKKTARNQRAGFFCKRICIAPATRTLPAQVSMAWPFA
jgi:hypothetical protein